MAIVLDGTPVTGTVEITVGAVTYIENNYSISEDRDVQTEYDENGIPVRAAYFPNPKQYSAEWQCAASATATPATGDEFTRDSLTFIISNAEESGEIRGIKKFSVSAQIKLSA